MSEDMKRLRFNSKSLDALAHLVCEGRTYYRKGHELPEFFRDAGLDCPDHNGSWRFGWSRERLTEYNEESEQISKVILELVNPKEYPGNSQALEEILPQLNSILSLEGLQVVLDGLNPILMPIATYQGVNERVKNLIFAANGPKPEIVLSDSVSNDIEIVKNAEYCLIYDMPIPPTGLSWVDLVAWWAARENLTASTDETARALYRRLLLSMGSSAEKLVFDAYYRTLRGELGDKLPALIPQVYLHYDPYTVQMLAGEQRLPRQRMDFLLLFSHHERVVIEVDGKQHYADNNTASPSKYAEMVAADRQLRLAGYEVYRFGGHELLEEASGRMLVTDFFHQLLRKHGAGK